MLADKYSTLHVHDSQRPVSGGQNILPAAAKERKAVFHFLFIAQYFW